MAGGAAREVLQPNDPIGGLEWTRDGRSILFSQFWSQHDGLDGLWQVSLSGGAAQKLDVPRPADAGLSLHPDGRRLAFTTEAQKLEIWVMENFLPAVEESR